MSVNITQIVLLPKTYPLGLQSTIQEFSFQNQPLEALDIHILHISKESRTNFRWEDKYSIVNPFHIFGFLDLQFHQY